MINHPFYPQAMHNVCLNCFQSSLWLSDDLTVPVSLHVGLRENCQRLQQDLAEMIVSSLEKRGKGRESFEKRKTLSTRRRETSSSLQGESSPEYFHLAVTDNPSTYL